MPGDINFPDHTTIAISSGGSNTLALSDAATTTAPVIFTEKHTTSGTAAAGFGISNTIDLQSGAGTVRRVATDDTTLTTATDGAEAAKRRLSFMLGGTLTAMIDLNTGNGTPLDIVSRDGTTNNAIVLSMAGDQRIGKTGSGDMYFTAGANQSIHLYTNGSPVIHSKNGMLQFFSAATEVAQQTGPTNNLTNSVTVGGTNGTIADFADLTTYSNSAATIRNDIYQLARGLKFVSDAMRAYNLIT